MMHRLVVCSTLALGMAGTPALAQTAAESAIILSGTGQASGASQRSLGAAIGGSIGNAANAIGAPSRSTARRTAWPRSAPHATYQVPAYATDIPGDVDPLDRTKAPSYSVGTGATIRVSGTMRQRRAPLSPPVPAARPR